MSGESRRIGPDIESRRYRGKKKKIPRRELFIFFYAGLLRCLRISRGPTKAIL